MDITDYMERYLQYSLNAADSSALITPQTRDECYSFISYLTRSNLLAQTILQNAPKMSKEQLVYCLGVALQYSRQNFHQIISNMPYDLRHRILCDYREESRLREIEANSGS